MRQISEYDIDHSFVVSSVAPKASRRVYVNIVPADAQPQGRHGKILAYAEILVFFADHAHAYRANQVEGRRSFGQTTEQVREEPPNGGGGNRKRH